MFQSARLKLTANYLVIIMLISVVFSAVIFLGIDREYIRVDRMQETRIEREQQGLNSFYQVFGGNGDLQIAVPDPGPDEDQFILSEARLRLQTALFLVNLAILGLAGVAGYYLAGRTLRPIQEMVDGQNRFITDASHELRTPVTSLKTSTEVYLRGKEHTLKEADQLHQSNLEEIENLRLLTDNLIKLTQYQNNHNHIHFEELSLTQVITDALKKVSNLGKHKKIKIEQKAQDYQLMADKQNLTELLVIFLDNAIKYSEEGKTVTIDSHTAGKYLTLEISDEGYGIEKKDLDHLFDRFYRADQARSRTDTGGYGLGLSIAKQIVEKHKGFIKVSSVLGKGTTFAISLRVKE